MPPKTSRRYQPKTVRRPYRSRRYPARRYYKKSPGSQLARFNYSKYYLSKNQAINNRLNKFAENNLLSLLAQNEQVPIPIQTGAIATYWGGCVGSRPSQWDSSLKDIQGLSITQGDQAGQRHGNYVYLQKSTVSVTIESRQSGATVDPVQPPTEFRIVVAKQRRGTMPAGVSFNPATSLFLDTLGNKIGYQTSGVNGTDLMEQPLNKRDWMIHTDKRFILSNWVTVNAGGYSGFYPCFKKFRFYLPYNKRTHYDNASSLPDDIDYHYLIIVFARSLNKDTTANDWELNLRGSTSFKDV